MDELIDQQLNIVKRISRVIEDLKKKGSAKIAEGILRCRLDGLEKLYTEFWEPASEHY